VVSCAIACCDLVRYCLLHRGRTGTSRIRGGHTRDNMRQPVKSLPILPLCWFGLSREDPKTLFALCSLAAVVRSASLAVGTKTIPKAGDRSEQSVRGWDRLLETPALAGTSFVSDLTDFPAFSDLHIHFFRTSLSSSVINSTFNQPLKNPFNQP